VQWQLHVTRPALKPPFARSNRGNRRDSISKESGDRKISIPDVTDERARRDPCASEYIGRECAGIRSTLEMARQNIGHYIDWAPGRSPGWRSKYFGARAKSWLRFSGLPRSPSIRKPEGPPGSAAIALRGDFGLFRHRQPTFRENQRKQAVRRFAVGQILISIHMLASSTSSKKFDAGHPENEPD